MTEANQSVTSTAKVLTKEEKLAVIDKQIANLQQRRYNVANDIVVTKAAGKVVVLPNVGDIVWFVHGRNTPTTQARTLQGQVLGIKPAAEGNEAEGVKRTPALVRVLVGDGIDAETLTIYPSVITAAPAAETEVTEVVDTSEIV